MEMNEEMIKTGEETMKSEKRSEEAVSGLSSALSSLSPEHNSALLAMVEGLPEALQRQRSQDSEIPLHAAERMSEKWREILDLYQEQPHLLDPGLQSLLSPLLENIRKTLRTKTLEEVLGDNLVIFSFGFLAHLSKVRGWKVMLRHLPHEVDDLQPLLLLLEAAQASKKDQWTLRYVGMLWLLILVKMPFELSRWDGSGDGGNTGKRLIEVAKRNCISSESCRFSAGRLYATLLCRRDLKDEHLLPNLQDFLRKLNDARPGDTTVLNEALAHAYVFAAVLKAGPRQELLPHATSLLQQFLSIDFGRLASTLADKLRTKILQRFALLHLRPQPSAWRYRRGTRSLAANLSEVVQQISATREEEEEEGYEISEDVESIVGALLEALGHDEGIVRWSAAKGLGRVAARLPKEASEDVTTSIVKGVLEGGDASRWHGGCLALAELGRRGALLPSQLENITELLVRGLEFEEGYGRGNVGCGVRDAACFLAWSFARTFTAQEMGVMVGRVGAALVQTALLDRELNCRRAASAAFQENVGRQGSFPAGLDIIATCDYFALSQTSHCYQKLVPFVASFQEYRPTLLSALFRLKVPHWDPNIRKLAAQAIGALATIEPSSVIQMAQDKLIAMTLGNDLFGRQGSLFAIGAVVSSVLSLPEGKDLLVPEFVSAISGIPGEMSRRGLVKGMGADWVRAGLNSLLQQLIQTGVWELRTLETAKEWVELLDGNLHNASAEIRLGAAGVWKAGLASQLQTLSGGTELWSQLRKEALVRVERGSVEVDRQSGALWLSAVGVSCLGRSGAEEAIKSLSLVSVPTGEGDKSWAEARRDCLAALGSLSEELGVSASPETATLVFESLLSGCDDYTIDVRGDIGKVVRETAVGQLVDFLLRSPVQSSDEQLKKALEKLIRLSCEKIDLTRKVAAEGIVQLLRHLPAPLLQNLPDQAELRIVYLGRVGEDLECDADVKWMSASDSFPRLGGLLRSPAWQKSALMGMAVSAGGLTESTSSAASEALLSFVQSLEPEALGSFISLCNAVIREKINSERVMGPMVAVVEKVMDSGVLEVFVVGSDGYPFLGELVGLIVDGTRKKKSPARVINGLRAVLGAIQLEWGSEVVRSALVTGLRTLGHVYPRVRRQVAALLYQSLLTYATLDNHSEQALAALTNTDWDAELESLQEVRQEIAARLGLPHPLPPYPSAL